MQTLENHEKKTFLADIYSLYTYLTPRRKFQLLILFVLQSLSAVSEVISFGAVIPFLNALINIDSLMKDSRMAFVLRITSITQPNDLIMLMAALFAIAIIVANILRFITLWGQLYLSSSIGTDFGVLLFRRTLYQPYSFFMRNNSSQLISNIVNDLSGTLGVIQSIFTIVTQLLIAIAICAGLLIYNTSMALILSGVVIVAFTGITFAIRKRLYLNSAIVSNSYVMLIKTLQEGFGGIRYIALNRTHDNFVAQYGAADRAFRTKSADNSVVRQAPRFFLESIGVTAISTLAMVFVMQGKDIKQIVPLMGFLAMGCYRLLPAVQQVYSSFAALMGLKVSLHRTVDILAHPVPETLLMPPKHTLRLSDKLEFENIYFDYKEDTSVNTPTDWTLKNLNFSIKAKTTVALVGTTGSGKSTIADIILGLNIPQKGTIKIDGENLNAANMSAWQGGIAHVPQHIFLMDCSIEENIAFGISPKHIDKARIHKAARLAKIDQFIETLPDKYSQAVGERGVRLSGGQLQRIGIARALYSNPSLIVFDEATSALDNKTEQDIMNSIEELGKELTIIMIAHRLSTVRNADKIFVFDHGHLVAEGTYNELIDTSQHFKKLALEFETETA